MLYFPNSKVKHSSSNAISEDILSIVDNNLFFIKIIKVITDYVRLGCWYGVQEHVTVKIGKGYGRNTKDGRYSNHLFHMLILWSDSSWCE